ncbi:MAG: hypothetical protein SGPRY_001150, partial [Prymnesium sp.]
RPRCARSGVGLLRYEDKADNTPTYADWPKWVYWDGSAWQDLETQPQIDPSTLYTGQVDMSAVGDSNAIVRTAVGAVSEGTTKSALEALTVSNLLAQILNVGPELEIMPVATAGVGAVYTVSPVDAQIGTNHTFSGQVQFNRGSYSPPQTSGDAFSAGNAISITMTDPFDASAVAFTGGGNTYAFSKAHTHDPSDSRQLYTVNGSVSHQAGGEALKIIGDVITSTLSSTFLVLTSKFNSDAVLEVYDTTFGWQVQTASTWTSENITVGSARVPYTRIHMPALQLPSDVRFECFDKMGGLVSPVLDLLELCKAMCASPQSHKELLAGDRYVKLFLNEIECNKIRFQKGRWIHEDGTPYDRVKYVRSLPEKELHLNYRCGRDMVVPLQQLE